MKIFYLITKSEEGGAQTHVAQLVRHFTERGHQVSVLSYPGGWLEKEVTESGAKFYPNIYFANSYNPFQLFRAIREIQKTVKQFQPDIVACHSSMASFLGRMVIRNKVPTVFTVHGWGFNNYVGLFSRIIALIAEKVAARYCGKIICVSEFVKDLAVGHKIATPEKFSVIYNGIEKLGEVKQHVECTPLKIVFVGRLADPKEPEILIKAYQALDVDLLKKAELLIIGDGPKRKMLESLVEKNDPGEIIFLGSVPRKEVINILEHSDIFVLASQWESFGLTALEAMSIGLPVIVSAVGGLKEVVDEDSGILILPSNIEYMKQALEKLINDQDLRKSLGECGKKRAFEKFSVEIMLERTENLYEELLRN